MQPGQRRLSPLPPDDLRSLQKLQFNASPSIVADAVYLFGKKGTLVVLAASREFKELERSELGEEVDASPAFADGRMYVRGATNLYCLGNP